MPSNSLPNEQDFDLIAGGLDAQFAWENFGGLTLEEAYPKFSENPHYYQECFMAMGSKAFAFYFPVIEDFLRQPFVPGEDDDRQAWILALCIRNQFSDRGLPDVRHLIPRVIVLCEYVLANAEQFDPQQVEWARVDLAWHELLFHIRAIEAGTRDGLT
jgi:hypothetical protein